MAAVVIMSRTFRPESLEVAQALLRSTRWGSRESGLAMLAALGRNDLIVAHAQSETIPAILDRAAELLPQEPPEFLVRRLTMTKGVDAPLAFRYTLPFSNYLYAEDAVLPIVAAHATRIHPDVIEGLGLSYFRSAVPLLLRYIKRPLSTFAAAKAQRGPKAVANISISVSSDGSDTWSREAACALAAATAVCRLDVPPPLSEIRRLLQELPAAMSPSRYAHILARSQLTWALMEADQAPPDAVISILDERPTDVLPDLLTSLLKRGESSLVEDLSRRFSRTYSLSSGAFVHWPLADFLLHRGLVDPGQPWRPLEPYLRARKRNLAPPPWWHWLWSPPPTV